MLNSAGYYTLPTQYNVAVALEEAQINMDPTSPDYLLQNLDNVYTDPDPRTYPLSSYVYMIEPTGTYPNPESKITTAKRQSIADFEYYSICQGQKEIGPIGYSPLPVNLVEAGFGQIQKLQQADPGVDLSNLNIDTCDNPTFVDGQPDTNYLATIAPMPPACDQVGAGPCAAGVTPNGIGPTPESSGTYPGQPRARLRRPHQERRAASGATSTASGAGVTASAAKGATAAVESAARRSSVASATTTTTQPEFVSATLPSYHAWSALAPLGTVRGPPASGGVRPARARRPAPRHAATKGRRLREGPAATMAALGRLWRIIVPSLLGQSPGAGAAASDTGAFTTTQTTARDFLVNGVDQVVDSRTVTLNVSQTDQPPGSPGDRGVVVGSASDGRHRGQPEFRASSVRGVSLCLARVPWYRLRCGESCSPAHARDVLDPDLERALPGQLRRRSTRRTGSTSTPRRRNGLRSSVHPRPCPPSCQDDEAAPVQHWVPFAAANGQVYYGGNAGCAGEPPESDDVDGSALPSNETFGVTGIDGTGSAEFDVFTSDRERLARLLADGGLRARRRPHHGHQLRSWRRCRPPPSPADVDAVRGDRRLSRPGPSR